MDVAVLGEIRDGREVVRLLAGDGGSFGLAVGASAPRRGDVLPAAAGRKARQRRPRREQRGARSRSGAHSRRSDRSLPRRSADHARCAAVHPLLPGARAATRAERTGRRVPPRPRRDNHPGASTRQGWSKPRTPGRARSTAAAATREARVRERPTLNAR